MALGTDLRKIILPAGMGSLSHICYTTPDGLPVGPGGAGLRNAGCHQGAGAVRNNTNSGKEVDSTDPGAIPL